MAQNVKNTAGTASTEKLSLRDTLGADVATERETIERLIGRSLSDDELRDLHDMMQQWGINADDPQWVMTRALAGVVYLCKSLPGELTAASEAAQARHVQLLAEQSKLTGLAIIRGLVPVMTHEASMELAKGRWKFWAMLVVVNMVTMAGMFWVGWAILKKMGAM